MIVRRSFNPVGIVVAILCIKVSLCVFDQKPRLKTSDGQLILESADNRNISLNARGSGCVNINGVDVSKAFKLVESVRPQLQVLNVAPLSYLIRNLTSVVQNVVSETRLADTLASLRTNLQISQTDVSGLRTNVEASQQRIQALFNNVTELRSMTLTPDKVVLIRNMTATLQQLKEYGTSSGNSLIGMQQRINGMESRLSRLTELQDRVRSLELSRNTTVQSNTGGESLRQIQIKYNGLKRTVMNILRTIRRDNCISAPCLNGGTCIDTSTAVKGYHCLCPSGFEGQNCGRDANECAEFVGTDLGCQNGATCMNQHGSYSCQCMSGWYGVHCTLRREVCSSSSASEICGHGTCIPTAKNGHPYYCLCDQGFKSSSSSPICNIDFDECGESRPACSADPPVRCINTVGSFVCGSCPAGYTGNGFSCRDIDECEINNGGCSLVPRVECINTRASFRCGPCPPGYTGNGIYCTAVSGPCQMNPCNHLASCRDNPQISASYYACTCPYGYTGNGIGPAGCQSTGSGTGSSNPCSSNPCAHGTCSNYQGHFVCTCLAGYTGATCNTMIDPCSSSPCLHGGSCSRSVVGYVCSCPPNYTGSRCEIPNRSCGGHLTGHGGSVSYPGPSQQTYSTNITCSWSIRTNRSLVISLTFTLFHLEGTQGCPYDWLEIHDGSVLNSFRLGRFCGTTLPGQNGTIISSHNGLFLWFRSDHSITGNGFNFNWTATEPVCGRDYYGQQHGAIISPGYPGHYPHNRDCAWTVRVNPGKKIKFIFATLALERHNNCSYDYLKIYDGLDDTSPLLQRYCSTQVPGPLVTSGNEAFLHFHSDSSLTDNGFHITFVTEPGIPGCGGTLSGDRGEFRVPTMSNRYHNHMECDWSISVPQGEAIQLNFTQFRIEHHYNCIFDYVEVYDGEDTESQLLGRFCGISAPLPILSTGNNLFVVFRTDYSVTHEGFTAEYEVVCGGEYLSSTGELKSPFYPNTYPHNRECTYVIRQDPGKAIVLNFTDFDIEGPGSRCYFDYLEIRDGSNSGSPLLGKYCDSGHHAPDVIISSLNILYLKFVTDGSVANRGFLAHYHTIDIRCGAHLTSPTGLVNSPNSPDSYPSNTDCNWVLEMTPGHVIQITWLAFTLEDHFNCRYDYIEVFDNSTIPGTGGRIGKKLCGTSLPPTMTSISNVVTVHFHSDSSVNHDGFQFSYHSLDTSRVCGGNYFTSNGRIRSPQYPLGYPAGRTCIWKINIPVNQQIGLNFTDFDLEEPVGDDCRYDYLEIRNGGQARSPLLDKLCGRNKTVERIISHSHQLYLKFSSDSSQWGRGFELFWNEAATGCGGELTSVTGRFTSPGYPSTYHHLATCYWNIRVNRGSSITLSFLDLSLASSSSSICYSDYVEVFNGASSSSPSLGRFCHAQGHMSLNSTGNTMHVKFRGGWNPQDRGFSARYHANCNVELRDLSGVIESPNFPLDYPHNRNCTWTIKAPRGNAINISFSDFDVEDPSDLSSTTCPYDFVEVKVGRQSDAVTTVKLHHCGNDPPADQYSGEGMDLMKIRFKSDFSIARNGFRLEYLITGCIELFRSPRGEFTSPNYPNAYPINTECRWLITGPPGIRIEITIHELDIESSPSGDDCIYDVLKVYGGKDTSGPVLMNFCHQSQIGRNYSVHTQGNSALVSFISDQSVKGKGFRASYRHLQGGCGGNFLNYRGTIHSPKYPGNFLSPIDCLYLITVDWSHVVKLELKEFGLRSSLNCSNEYLAIYDGNSTDGTLLFRNCSLSLPSPVIIKSFGHQMTVRLASSDSSEYGMHKFSADYKTGCGATLDVPVDESSHALTSPNFPGIFHKFADCTWHLRAPEGSKVRLVFTSLDIQSGQMLPSNINVTCSMDYVAVYDGDGLNSTEIRRHCGSHVPREVFSTSRWLTVHLYVHMGHGVGFRALYTALDTACGGEFASMSGEFASPNYPDSYPLNYDCEWNIRSGEGNRVQLNFQLFSIEESDGCNLDYVEVHEKGPHGRLLLHNCSNSVPGPVIGTGGLWVNFKSDGQGTAAGFLATFSLLLTSVIYSDNGYIESPLYPLLYTRTNEFTWKVTVSQGQTILLSEFELAIEMNSVEDVCYSSLVIHRGENKFGPVIETLCGYSLSRASIPIFSQVIFVRFLANNRHEGSSFRFKYEAVDNIPYSRPIANSEGVQSNCSFILAINETTSISSPNYPENYANNLNCEWILESTIGTRVFIRFNTIRLEEVPGCYFDKIEVYDGIEGKKQWHKNSTLCRRSHDHTTFRSTGRFLRLRFITDSSQTRSGFSARARPICGGFISESEGVITTPNYPSNYNYFSRCTWKIKVKQGRTIQLQFDTFSIMSGGDTCDGGRVVIRNGLTTSSPFLGNGQFCGNSIPTLPESSSNVIMIVFTSNFPNRERGFRLTYHEVSAACGGRHHLRTNFKQIVIESPNFPNPPHPHTECEWVVTGIPNMALGIDFSQFDVSNLRDTECEHAYVEIRDGGTRLSPLLGTHNCGSRVPSSQVSSGSALYIRYYTNAETVHSGFNATVTTGHCGGTQSSQSGLITSPKYPDSYEANNDCTWNVIVKRGHLITFQFPEIRLHSTSDVCSATSSNRLLIKDTRSNASTTICGMRTDVEPFSTASFSATMNFKSNSIGSGTNRFQVAYNASMEECGGSLTGARGSFHSPGYPHGFSHQYWCTWTIVGPPGRRIILTIEDIDMQGAYSFILVYNGLISRYASHVMYHGRINTEPITTSMNKAKIRFFAWQASSRRGFNISWDATQPQECGGTLPGPDGVIHSPGREGSGYNHSMYCEWTINNPNPTSSSISIFLDYLHLEDYCYDYLLVESVAPSGETFISDKICEGTTTNSYIIPYPTARIYFISDYSVNMTGFNISYKINDCGGYHTGPQDTFSSPSYPGNYPPNSACAWLFSYEEGSQIELEFGAFNLEASVHHDYVKVLNGPSFDSPVIGQYAGTTPPESILSMNSFLYVVFRSDPTTSASGFSATTRLHSLGCGGIFHKNSGNISSPGYRDAADYSPNVECQWQIEVEPGYQIRTKYVERFDLETNSQCQNDFVQVLYPNTTGDETSWIGDQKFCGKQMPPPIETNSSSIRVLFRSNEDIQGKGFKLSWNVTCGGNYHSREGFILSPSHPDSYPHNSMCIYNIIASPQSYVLLNFTVFDVEKSYYRNHCYDTLTIKEKRWSRWRVRKTLCGRELPELEVIKGPATLNFTSDDYGRNNKGFLIKYSIKDCGGNRTTAGKITLPMHPREYHHRMRCFWTITAPENNVILFKFQALDLEYHRACRWDHVTIYDGAEASQSAVTNKFCGNHSEALPSFVTKTSVASVLFESDYIISRAGFVLAYYFTYSCGGNVNISSSDATYTIRSPDADNDGNYEQLLMCEWTIVGAEGMVVAFNFSRLEVEGPNENDTEHCPYDSVEVFDGFRSKDNSLGVFCDSPESMLIVIGSHNIMYVVFKSDSSGQNAAGFTATVQNIPNLCGPTELVATNVTQRIHSPNYAAPYPMSTRCSWYIRAPGNIQRIHIHIDDMDIDLSSHCVDDRLFIQEYQANTNNIQSGNSNTGRHTISIGGRLAYFSYSRGLDHVYCGSPSTHNLNSVTNKVQISFQSDATASEARGFDLHYSLATCNMTYNSTSGTILSRASRSGNCFTRIIAPSGKYISLYYLYFYLPVRQQGQGSFKVYSGLSDDEENRIEDLRGYSANPTFSNSNEVLIKLIRPSRWFYYKINFVTSDNPLGCGGEFFGKIGFILTSPNYPNAPPTNQDCMYTVTVPSPRHAAVRFRDFSFMGDSCNSTYLELYDILPSNEARLFTTYCSGDEPADHLSPSNKLAIRFVTGSTNLTGIGWRIIGRGFIPHEDTVFDFDTDVTSPSPSP